MQVAPRRCHAGVPEGGLHEVDRRSAVEAVRGVGVPEPVRRDVGRQARSCGRGLADQQERVEIECASIRHDPAEGSVTLDRVDLATWQRVRFGRWTHLAWKEADQELLVGKIEGPILSALDGFQFTLKDVK